MKVNNILSSQRRLASRAIHLFLSQLTPARSDVMLWMPAFAGMTILVTTLMTTLACTPKASKVDEQTLVLGTHAAYPPYESVDNKGDIVGFDIDVANAVAQKLGKRLVIQNMSFDALVLALKQNKFDFIMGGISITPSRQKEIALVPYQGQPITELALLFWNNAPGNIKAVADLKDYGNHTVATQTGTFMDHYLSKVSGITPKTLEGTIELILDLKHGKSAAVLLEPHIANAVMPKHPQLKRIDIALPKEEWVLGNGIGIAKGNLKLITQMQETIQQLKSEGVIAELEAKWFQAGSS